MRGSAPKSHNIFGQWIVVIQTCQCKHMLCLVRLVKSMVIWKGRLVIPVLCHSDDCQHQDPPNQFGRAACQLFNGSGKAVVSSDASIFFCLHTLCLFNIATAAIYIICDFLLICLVLKWWLSIATLSNLRVCTVSRFAYPPCLLTMTIHYTCKDLTQKKKNKMLHSHHVWVKVNTAHDCSSITFMASFNFTNLGCFFAIFSNPRKDSEQFKITIVLVGHLPLHNLAKFNHLSVSENEFYLLPEWLF